MRPLIGRRVGQSLVPEAQDVDHFGSTGDERGNLRVDAGEQTLRGLTDPVTRLSAVVARTKKGRDLSQGETKIVRVADHAKTMDDGGVVLAVAGGCAAWFWDEAQLLVVPDCAARHLCRRRDLPDRQAAHAVDPTAHLTLRSTRRFSIDRMNKFVDVLTAIALAGLSASLGAAQHPEMPPGMTHEQHLAQMKREAEMKARGAAAMGFDQDAVAHHFVLTKDGGIIQVDVLDPNDQASLRAIRSHLQQIAAAFQEGNFDAPLTTHAEVPDGVPVMRRLASTISYFFGDTPKGGRVHIVTANEEALAAVHGFLRYQIREHRTGDLLDVSQ